MKKDSSSIATIPYLMYNILVFQLTERVFTKTNINSLYFRKANSAKIEAPSQEFLKPR